MRVRFSIPPGSKLDPLLRSILKPLTSRQARKHVTEASKRSEAMAVIKPERSLGAPWIDNFVALRRIVALCEDCYRKYDKWWKRYNYSPLWGHRVISDCDGCSRKTIYCTDFYPEESGRRGILH